MASLHVCTFARLSMDLPGDDNVEGKKQKRTNHHVGEALAFGGEEHATGSNQKRILWGHGPTKPLGMGKRLLVLAAGPGGQSWHKYSWRLQECACRWNDFPCRMAREIGERDAADSPRIGG